MCSCFGWLWKEGLIVSNPCGNLEPIKCPKMVKKAFSPAELERIKEACGNNLRDKAVVCFLLATGCRIEETTLLNRNDIDLVNKEITVFGKGAKERTVYLDEIAASVLQRYFASRKDDSPALFPGRGSKRMTTGGLRAMLKRIEDKCGVENIHPHRFRRTLATILKKKGMPIEEISIILGHEDIRTTMKYICIDKTDIKHNYLRIVA